MDSVDNPPRPSLNTQHQVDRERLIAGLMSANDALEQISRKLGGSDPPPAAPEAAPPAIPPVPPVRIH